MESTSISSITTRVPGGIDSNLVAEVEAIYGDGSGDPGETVDVDGGFSSTMGHADTVWSASPVRTTIETIRVVLGFLVTSFLVPFFCFGLGIVGFWLCMRANMRNCYR